MRAGSTKCLFTGDELTATEAAAAGMILECVPDDELLGHATALAHRMATLPLNQLQMMKWMLNDVARHQYRPRPVGCSGSSSTASPATPRRGSTSSHALKRWAGGTPSHERDRPFGDYGERR